MIFIRIRDEAGNYLYGGHFRLKGEKAEYPSNPQNFGRIATLVLDPKNSGLPL